MKPGSVISAAAKEMFVQWFPNDFESVSPNQISNTGKGFTAPWSNTDAETALKTSGKYMAAGTLGKFVIGDKETNLAGNFLWLLPNSANIFGRLMRSHNLA